MKGVLIICVLGIVAMWVNERIHAEYQRGFGDALKTAYKTNPPSDQLEMVCAGLWVGEQNKKWHEKNK